MSCYNMPSYRRPNRVRPRRRSVTSVFSLRSFDYKSNRFLKGITVACILTIVVIVSVL